MLRWWLRHVLVFLSLATYVGMAPFGYLGFAVFSAVPGISPLRRARIVQGIVRRAFASIHGWMCVMGVVHYRAASLGPLLPAGPHVIVANHPTLTDTTAIMGSVPQVCAVVRSDLYSRPLLGALFRAARYLDAGGKSVQAAAHWMDEARLRLREGFSLLVFPEGTRSPRHGHRAFGRVAFELSCQSQVPVLALLIREEPRWLGKGGRFFPLPRATAYKKIEVLGVFRPESFASDSRSLRSAVEEAYTKSLGAVSGVPRARGSTAAEAPEASVEPSLRS